MKILLLVPLFLLLTTSFKDHRETDPPMFLGSMELYLTSDNQVVLIYRGIYPYCYMKYAADIMFIECDTMLKIKSEFDSVFRELHLIPLDSLKLFQEDTVPIQKIRM